MSRGINLRAANEADVTVIGEIFNDVIMNTTAIYQNSPMTDEQMKEWWDFKKTNSWPVLVAESAGQTIGFCTYGPFRPRECYQPTVELAIHVAQDQRGLGVGTMLLQALIANARERGFHSMIAGIDAANSGSIRLHRKLGFQTVAEIKEVGYKFDRWLDLTLMQLRLEGASDL